MTSAGYQDAGGAPSTEPGINPSRRRFLSIAALSTAAAGAGFTGRSLAHEPHAAVEDHTFEPSGPLDTARSLPCEAGYTARANSQDIERLQHEPISFPPDFREWDPDELQASGWLH